MSFTFSLEEFAALYVLQAVGCLEPEIVGPIDAETVKRNWEQNKIIEELTSWKR